MAELSLEMQQFLFRIKEAKAFLDGRGVNAQELIRIYDRMKHVYCLGLTNRFTWYMRAAEDHVVLSLHAPTSDADDLKRRDQLALDLEQIIDPAKVRFSVLLHYKDR